MQENQTSEIQDILGTDTELEPVSDSKKSGSKKKKQEQGSDVAFFVCFPAFIFACVAGLVSIAGLIPLGGSVGQIFEVLASLRAQLMIVLLLCMLPAPFSPPWRMKLLAVSGVFLLLNALFVLPIFLPAGTKPEGTNTYLAFKVMQIRLDGKKPDVQKVLDAVAKENAEIVCIENISSDWMVKFNEQETEHRYRALFPREDEYGICIYSRAPLRGSRRKSLGADKIPIVLTSIHYDYGWFNLVVARLPDPVDGPGLDKRNAQAEALANVVKGLPGRKILVGNFNMTPYSMTFGKMKGIAELQDTRQGIGIQPNWHWPSDAELDVYFLRFPVDHILVNSQVGTKSRRIGADFGATHRPIVAELFPANADKVEYKEPPLADDESVSAADPAPPPVAAPPASAAEDKAKVDDNDKDKDKKKKRRKR